MYLFNWRIYLNCLTQIYRTHNKENLFENNTDPINPFEILTWYYDNLYHRYLKYGKANFKWSFKNDGCYELYMKELDYGCMDYGSVFDIYKNKVNWKDS